MSTAAVMHSLYGWLLIVVCAGLSACRPAAPVTSPPAPQDFPTPAATYPPGPPTPAIANTDTPTGTPLASALPTTPALQLCSPFPGYSLAQLSEAVSNPFHPPPPGSDDPHQGVDLAVKQGEIALAGEPVQAVMMGRVAAVIEDRFPYGNALLLETPLQALPPDWLDPGWIPALAPTLSSNPALTCPTPAAPPALDFSRRSLYVLYAHMQAKADYQLGQTVRCGEQIGEIGQSGNALAPHLHLEVRVGPSGERFVGLAHYETRASSEEMSNYCVWRVSGVYQLVDPLQLLAHLDD